MPQFIPLTEAKAHLSELMDRIERHERIIVTRNGRPVGVLMHPDDLESLEETLDIMSDPKEMASIRKSLKEAKEGKALPLEQALGRKWPTKSA